MKLLVITQKVDSQDPILGFFHRWLEEFAKHCEQVVVICLQKGHYDLPNNVKVYSLGKEQKISKWRYILNFYKILFKERKNYQSVFVHMNQEYVLLAGLIWRLTGKKIILWRNHPAGDFLANIAIALAQVVCCTSKQSYTARFKKTKIMPVGIDTDQYSRLDDIVKQKNSILFLGRISPIKHPEILLQALEILHQRGINFSAHFFGEPLAKHQEFYESLKEQTKNKGLDKMVFWHSSVLPQDTAKIYNQFEIFVNLTTSGSFDKTIFEAMACQTIILASNESLRGEISPQLIFEYQDSQDLADKIQNIFLLSEEQKLSLANGLRGLVVQKHNLKILITELIKIYNNL